MKVWTIQPVEVMNSIHDKGYFACDRRKASFNDIESFQSAYFWMVKKMDEKGIIHPAGLEFPIWCWHTRNGKHKKPDLRNAAYAERGRKCVCLELEVPDQEILLSNYDTWHIVLNQWWFNDSNTEEEYYEHEKLFETLDENTKKAVMEESWDKIFNITSKEDRTTINCEYVQGVFWVLKKEYIKKVQEFVAR
ncbi:MAG: DUF3841 domain-containing protein [bacterium]|nr:DUF3841 domain-containing protein [bacterium]